MLAYENLALVQAIETSATEPLELLRFRLGFDAAEWSIQNSLGNRRGIGFGASKAFEGKAGSVNGTDFLNDIPLAGDWAGLGNANIGSARWQQSAIDSSKRTWNFTISTDRDAHVDQSYNFPVQFEANTLEASLPVPLAGDLDGKYGADLAIVDVPASSSTLRWRFAMQKSGVSIAYPESEQMLQQVMFGASNGKPVAGYFRSVNGTRQPGIAVVSVQGSLATWSILYLNANGFYSNSDLHSERIEQQLGSSIDSANWQPIAGDFDGDGVAELALVEHRTGQMWLHVVNKPSADQLTSNSSPADRIVVGNWALSQWSSNNFYASRPSPSEYTWDSEAAQANWQGSDSQLRGTPQPTSNVVVQDRFNGTPIENRIRFQGVNRQAATTIIGRAVLSSNLSTNSSNIFAAPTRFSRLRIEGGSNTFSDSTTIDPSTLQGGILSGIDTPEPYNNPSLNPLGYAIFATSGTTTFSGVVSTSQPTVVTGGEVEFSGSNSLLGTIDVSGSGKVILSGSGVALTQLIIGSGGVVEITGANISINAISIASGGILRMKSQLTAVAINTNGGRIEIESSNQLGSLPITVRGGGVTFVASLDNGGASFGNAIALLDDATVTFDWTGAGSPSVAFGYSGIISGSGNLRKTGLGFLNLTRQLTYTGSTLVDAGELLIGVNNALPTNTTLTIAANAIVNQEDRTLEVGAITGDGTLQGKVGSTLTVGRGNNSSAFGGRLISSTVATLDSGSLGLVKVGSGTLTLSGNNTYTGTTSVVGGTVEVNGRNAIPIGSAISIASSATLRISNTTQQLNSLGGDGTVELATGSLELITGTAVSLSARITGAGGFTKAGLADLTVLATSSFVGETRIDRGRLIVGAADVLSNNSNIVVASGAELNFGFSDTVPRIQNQGTVNATPPSVALSVSGDFINETGATLNLGARTASLVGSLDNSGTVNLGGTDLTVGGLVLRSGRIDDAAQAGTITTQSAYDLRSGTINANLRGDFGLLKSSTNTVALGGQNSFTRATTVQAGTLSLTASGALPATPVTVQNGILLLNNNNQLLGELSGAGQVQLGSATLTIQALNPVTFDGTISGTGRLRKTGNGLWTLSTANTFTGGLDIAQGSLQANGAGSLGTGSVQVQSDGTLNIAAAQTLTRLTNAGTLNINTSVVQLSGDFLNSGTLNPSNSTLETTGLSGIQTIDMGAAIGGSLLVSGSSNVQLSSSSNNLTLNTVTVRGGSLDAGAKTVAVQALVMDSATATLRGTGSLSSNTIFDLRSGIVSIPLTGSLGINKSTIGTVTLSATNNFTGGVDITQGSLQANGANSLGTGSVQVQSAGTLNIAAAQTLTRITNVGTLNINTSVVQLSGDFLNSGTLNPGNSTLETTGLSGAQTIDMGAANGGSLLISGPSDVQLSSSSNNLTLNTLTVRGGSVDAGAKTLAVQSLVMDSATATLRGTGSLSSNTTFDLRSGNVSIPLTGSAGVRKATNGSVSLTSANGYTGSTTVEQGVLGVQTSGGLGGGAVDIATSGTLTLFGIQSLATATNSGSLQASSATLRMGGNLDNFGSMAIGTLETVRNDASELRLNIGSLATLNNLTTVGASPVQLIASSASIAITGTLQLGLGSLDAADKDIVTSQLILDGANATELKGTGSITSTSTYDLRSGIVAMDLSGTAGLRKSTAGTVRLDVPTTYTGNTEVLQGNLAVNFANAISVQSPILVSSRGSLALGDFPASVHSISNKGNVQVGEAELAIANDLVNDVGGTFESGASKLVLSGHLLNQGSWPSATSTLDLTGSASSQRLLSGGASFKDVTHLGTGELIIEDETIASGEFNQTSGSVRLAGGDLNVGTLVWSQGELQGAQNSSPFILNIANSATFQSGQINAPIQGGSVWTKTGTDGLVFSTPVEYGLRLNIQQGDVQVVGSGALPVERDLRIAANGRLDLQTGNASFANVEVAGMLNVEASTFIVRPTDRSALGESISASVSGTVSGANGFIKRGAGTLTWAGVNNIDGVYSIDEGQLVLSNDAALAANSNLDIGALGVVQVQAASVSNSELTGAGELNIAAGGALETRRGQFAGTLRGNGSILKQGADNWELTGSSRGDFAGSVRVLDGGLIVNGTLPAAKVTVNSGSVLSGRGRLGDTSILAGAILSPGNSPGSMQLASLRLARDATLSIELEGKQAGTTYDQVIVNGIAQLDGGIIVRFTDALKEDLSNFDFFDLIRYGSISGTPTLAVNNGDGNFRLQISILPASYRLVIFLPVPPIQIICLPKTPEEGKGPPDNNSSTTNYLVAYEESDEQPVETDQIPTAEDEFESDASQWLDRSDSLSSPPLDPIAAPDIASAAIDSALAEGLTFEMPSIASDMQPLSSKAIQAIALPSFETLTDSSECPDWKEPVESSSGRRPFWLLTSGLTSTVLGLAAMQLAWLKLKRERQQQPLESQGLTALPEQKNASGGAKHATSDAEGQKENVWTIE